MIEIATASRASQPMTMISRPDGCLSSRLHRNETQSPTEPLGGFAPVVEKAISVTERPSHSPGACVEGWRRPPIGADRGPFVADFSRKGGRYEPGVDLAAHCGATVMQARPRKPRDKAKVEASSSGGFWHGCATSA